jgi:hypothetical protein
MAVVEVYHKRYETHTIGSEAVHLERLVVLLRIRQTPNLILECFVDTGAYLTVFPQNIWKEFEASIHWLTAQEESELPQWCKQFRGAVGGSNSCRLGRIAVEFCDCEHPPHIIGPVDIFALFASDGGKMKRTLVGLGGGVYHKRRLLLAYDLGRTWIKEMVPP